VAPHVGGAAKVQYGSDERSIWPEFHAEGSGLKPSVEDRSKDLNGSSDSMHQTVAQLGSPGQHSSSLRLPYASPVKVNTVQDAFR
jgi:hypothetical protein